MKRVVMDTNVLLDRPLDDVLRSFTQPTHVIIPLIVLNELDKFKKGKESINEHCRATTRFLDNLRKFGKLHQGVQFEKHLIQVEVQEGQLDSFKNDHQIIQVAKQNEATLISQDINMRVIADALEIDVENFAPENVNVDQLYTGMVDIDITMEQVQQFHAAYKGDGVEITHYISSEDAEPQPLYHNQFVIMHDPAGGRHEGIFKKNLGRVLPLKSKYEAWNITAKKDKYGNVISEQRFLLDLLLDPEIEFVTALGPSGCGKTFLTIAAALEQVMGRASARTTYSKIVVMRPLIPIGKDIGYLPGDKFEKLEPWMGSTFDTLNHLLSDGKIKDVPPMATCREKIEKLIQLDCLELEAMAHIRGRSIPNQFIIVDDAQNLTQDQAASIITRAGEGSKVVFLGDISDKQIDDHRLTPSNNGLAYVVDRFKDADIVGHITLEHVVRSKLAQLGVERL